MSNFISPWIPIVQEVANGQSVDAAVVNAVSDQLVGRDQYLYDTLNSLQNKSVLVSTAQPISPAEITAGVMLPGSQWAVYYFNDDAGNVGVSRAIASFGNSISTTFYSPNNSCFTFGIAQNITTLNTADVYTQGLLNLSSPLDDSTNGLLDFVSAGVRETFVPGALYLSPKTAGLLTYNPSGLTVFVGYALDDSTILLNPQVNAFSQLFYSTQCQILDRPAGIPTLSSTTWSLSSVDLTRLGWVPVGSLPGAYTVPTGAKWFYNIPDTFATDNADNSGTDGVANGTTTFTSSSATFVSAMVGLPIVVVGHGTYNIVAVNSTTSLTLSVAIATATGIHYSIGSLTPLEKEQAALLKTLLPPDPATQSILTSNGIQQIQAGTTDAAAIYSIDEFGIWWYSDQMPKQPWPEDLPSGTWTPNKWLSVLSTDTERQILNLIFTKFNPNLSSIVVSSLSTYADGTSNMVKLLNQGNLTQAATTGNLVIQTSIPFDTPVVATTSPTALTDLTFSQATGKLTSTSAPVVSVLSAVPNSGITITETPSDSGSYIIGFNDQGTTGALDSLEPINSTVVYYGLNSFLQIPYSTTVQFGCIGKISLSSLFPANQNVYIVVQAIGLGSVSGAAQNAAFSFNYNVSSCTNGASPASVIANNTTGSGAILSTSTSTTGSGFALMTFPTGYVAYEALTFQPTQFVIPAANIGPDSIINFQIIRQMAGSSNYTSPVGFLTVYYSLIP